MFQTGRQDVLILMTKMEQNFVWGTVNTCVDPIFSCQQCYEEIPVWIKKNILFIYSFLIPYFTFNCTCSVKGAFFHMLLFHFNFTKSHIYMLWCFFFHSWVCWKQINLFFSVEQISASLSFKHFFNSTFCSWKVDLTPILSKIDFYIACSLPPEMK